MRHDLLLDYDLAVARDAYVVRALLRLTGRAPDASSRIPLNLSIVLDRSGSMAGEKLDAARRAAEVLVHRLFPDDVVSVVTYDDEVRTVAQPGSGAEQPNLTAAIRAIESGGSTNLSGGWLRGRELVAGRLQPAGVNRVLLMTDGLANVGITDAPTLTGLCAEARRHGIATSTIGFGRGYNEHLLRAMADGGGGHTYYIERPDQAPAVFQDEIEGLLSLSAQNIAVEIHPVGAAGFARVHHSYPLTGLANGVRLELGDLYAREPKSLLMEFVVPAAAAGADLEIARVRVTADVLTAGGGVERQEVTLSVRTALSPEGHAEPEVRREVLLQEAARAREAALEAERRGDYLAAELSLRETMQRIRRESTDPDALAEADDLAVLAETCAAGAVSEEDRKYMHQRAYDVSRSKMASIVNYDRADRRGPIRYRRGDATVPSGPGLKLIAHAVDVGGAWGTGFSTALGRRWPQVEAAYRQWVVTGVSADGAALEPGALAIVPVGGEVAVALLIARGGPAGARPLVDYPALQEALRRLRDEALRSGSSVHMPRIASAVGGASWPVVEQMIEGILCAAGVPVTVYDPR